jgi:hypothetical protein
VPASPNCGGGETGVKVKIKHKKKEPESGDA